MARKKDKPPPKFPWWKAIRSSATKGAAAGTTAGVSASVIGEPTTILIIAGTAGGATAAGSFIGDIVNHFFDDPSPVFDAPTTTLFDLVGMTVCFLLFVVPAMILDATVNPTGTPLPSFFGFVAFGFSGFLVSVLRGLLINLGVVSGEDDEQAQSWGKRVG